MNPFQAFLHLLSDPNIAALLFSIGSLGLIYELMSPNFVTGILGGIAIILAFIGSDSLPLNVAGLLLIGLAMVLFVLEFNRHEPRPAHGRRARLLRAGHVRAVHDAGRPVRPDRPGRDAARRRHDRDVRRSSWASSPWPPSGRAG